MELKIDTVYDVDHSRKGNFQMLITADNGEWIKGKIVKGKTDTIMPYNVEYEGDFITVRKSFCTFTEVVS
jgi:hypothetical protein